MHELSKYKRSNHLFYALYNQFDVPCVVLLKDRDKYDIARMPIDHENWLVVAYLGVSPMWLVMDEQELTTFVLRYPDSYLYKDKLVRFEQKLGRFMDEEQEEYDATKPVEWNPFHSIGNQMRLTEEFGWLSERREFRNKWISS